MHSVPELAAMCVAMIDVSACAHAGGAAGPKEVPNVVRYHPEGVRSC